MDDFYKTRIQGELLPKYQMNLLVDTVDAGELSSEELEFFLWAIRMLLAMTLNRNKERFHSKVVEVLAFQEEVDASTEFWQDQVDLLEQCDRGVLNRLVANGRPSHSEEDALFRNCLSPERIV